MSFYPPREPTKLPPPVVFAVTVAAMGLIAGGAYLLIFDPSNKPQRAGTRDPDDPIYELLAPPPDQPGGISRPERITIPAIGVDGPVLQMRLGPDGNWDADSIVGEVGHLQGTPWPGEEGNTVLAAHVTVPEGAYGPFKDLEAMEPGQLITIWARDRTIYRYRVTEKQTVLATAVEVLAPTETQTLTLITCSGWDGDQQTYLERVVVTAELVSTTRGR